MEILSFVLGMSMVVVIAVAIVAVIAFVKVKKTEKEIDALHQIIQREMESERRERDKLTDDMFRTMDSRFDKFEIKITNGRKA